MTQAATPLDLMDIGDSEERYRAVIDALAEGIVLQNQQGTILASNASAARILQMTPDELHGRASIDPEWRAIREDGTPFPGNEHPAMVTLRTGDALSNVVMGVRRGKDEPTWISINTRALSRTGAALPYAVVSSFADITTAKNLENQLRQSEEKYRTLFESSMDGALLARVDGTILSANKAACEMLRRSEAEIIAGGRAGIVDLNDPRLAPALAERARTGSMKAELTLMRGDGTTIPVEVTSAVFQGANGEQRTNLLFRDITERLRLDRMKNEFLSTVSHELRTPLTAIRGALGLLGGGVLGSLPEAANEYVRMATLGTERLSRLLNDILDFAKLESGNFLLQRKLVDSSPLVDTAGEVGRGLAAAANVSLSVDIRAQTKLLVDPERIVQVLLNLISNATKFSPPGSCIELVVQAPQAGRLRFAVTDRGQGIPAADVPRLFTRFYQVDSSDSRARGGTGLGLAISKSIIDAHGGKIGVATDLGKGSTFWFELESHAR